MKAALRVFLKRAQLVCRRPQLMLRMPLWCAAKLKECLLARRIEPFHNFDRPRYQHLRIGGPAEALPEMQPGSGMPSDDTLDLTFVHPGAPPSPSGITLEVSSEGWRSNETHIKRRPIIDPRTWNPVKRTAIPSATIDADLTTTPQRMKQARTVRIAPGLAPQEEQLIALRALACGSPVIATSSLKQLNWPGVVADADAMPDTLSFEATAAAGLRFALREHSTWSFADEAVTALGLPPARTPSITILAVTQRPKLLPRIFEVARQQTIRPCQLVVVLHTHQTETEQPTLPEIEGIETTVTHLDPSRFTFGEALDIGVDHAHGRLVAKIDDDDFYAPHHLEDLLYALQYSGTLAVGRPANYVYLAASNHTILYDGHMQHRYAAHLPGATLLTTRELLLTHRFGQLTNAIDSAFLAKIRSEGIRPYAIARHGFVRFRGNDHTAKFNDQWWLKHADDKTPLPGMPAELGVIT